MHSRIMATILGLVAEIERELIALRTREALAKRKVEGKPLGRPKGRQAARLNLNATEAEIRAYLAKGISKQAIAKLVECAPSTLCDWLTRRDIRPRRRRPQHEDETQRRGVRAEGSRHGSLLQEK